jgi:hypothetical protein
MCNLETAFAKLSNATLRQIVEDDRKLRGETEAWATREGYAAIILLGRRRTFGTLVRFEEGMTK